MQISSVLELRAWNSKIDTFYTQFLCFLLECFHGFNGMCFFFFHKKGKYIKKWRKKVSKRVCHAKGVCFAIWLPWAQPYVYFGKGQSSPHTQRNSAQLTNGQATKQRQGCRLDHYINYKWLLLGKSFAFDDQSGRRERKCMRKLE